MQSNYVSQQHYPIVWSDHAIVSLCIKPTPDEIRGQGYWKFNTALLLETQYKEYMTEKLQEWIALLPEYSNIQLWWENTKLGIKEATIAYATVRARKYHRRISLTIKEIQRHTLTYSPDLEKLTEARERDYSI